MIIVTLMIHWLIMENWCEHAQMWLECNQTDMLASRHSWVNGIHPTLPGPLCKCQGTQCNTSTIIRLQWTTSDRYIQRNVHIHYPPPLTLEVWISVNAARWSSVSPYTNHASRYKCNGRSTATILANNTHKPTAVLAINATHLASLPIRSQTRLDLPMD